MNLLKTLSIALITFFVCACSKDDTSNSNVETVKDIYACGHQRDEGSYINKATLWTNGEATTLAVNNINHSATAQGVGVLGNDVYVVGYEEINEDIKIAKIWKNGMATDLTDGAFSGFAQAIAFNNNDVYVLGNVKSSEGYFVPTVWKNNTEISKLTDGMHEASGTSIVVKNNDVYVVGYEYNESTSIAKLWKNGIATNLTDETTWARATDLAILGSDVYVVGYFGGLSGSTAKAWKNAVPYILKGTITGTYECSISIAGHDVYIAGKETSGAVNMLKLWKNGETTTISQKSITFEKIKVVDADVYVAGNEYKSANAIYTASLLKNGVELGLESPYASLVNGMFITTN